MADHSSIDVLILCGGLGKRLRPAIGETQKVMAEVGGRPFLDRLLDHFRAQGFSRVILGTGYQGENVERYYDRRDAGLELVFSRETEPLGTGGAVRNAEPLVTSDPFFVLNGDSFCPVGYAGLLDFHRAKNALVSVVVTREPEMKDFGSLMLEPEPSDRIAFFKEKLSPGKLASAMKPFCNAGVYCFSRQVFSCMPQDRRFSLEEDFFPLLSRDKREIYGYVFDGHFVDIGTPERYNQVKKGGAT